MTNRIRTLLVAVLFLGMAAACGSSSSGGSTGGSGSGSGSTASGNTVTIQSFQFHPATLTVKAGTKVTFTNEDGTPHTATANPGSSFDSGSLSKGQSFTFTFSKPGTYTYICNFHQTMKGTIVVQ
ncbi:MAG: cupredoxin family copper-binding protein [Frankiaceae bacterium]|nr:cupredoxin family copper-binding protein [Frankiaceae bacterium]MBV9872268.1 cupredoxin family copper-binding protein [Frankiaceae bacterium]